ncbi:hypothetical protein C8J57DRAFT_705646 [Mycena rebaudengoi]|nr:hypothetical protein C8J57DRAFT_705646 [Mycena rebaudengoi]
MLCANRFPLPGSPSTCQLDTAIVPLPSFFLLVALAANFFLSKRGSKTKITSVKWLHITYLVLVGAQFGMTVVELVRLVLEKMGVGLLPVTSIAYICVFVILWRERPARTRPVLFIFAVYWFFLTIFLIVKSVRLQRLVELNPTTTKTSQYPSSDWLLDNVVMLGLSFLFLCTECTTLFLSRRQAVDPAVAYRLQSNV